MNQWARTLRRLRRELTDAQWRALVPRLGVGVAILVLLVAVIAGAAGRPDPRLKPPLTVRRPVTQPSPQLQKLEAEVEKNPSSATARTQLGQEYLEHNELSGALGQFSAALQMDEKRHAQGQDPDGESALGVSQIAARIRDAEAALVLAQRAAQRKPKDPEAWNALAVAYSMSGKDRQATETFLKSLEAFPKHRRLKLNAAAHFGKLKDWPRAETQARAALAMPPQDGIARSLLATLLLRQGRTQEGEQELLRLTRERPEDPGPHFVLGKVRMGQKNVAGARAAFEEAARIRPKEPLPQIYIGMTYLLSNDLPGAERSYEKALALDGSVVSAQLGVATIRHLQGRKEEAIQSYERLAQSQPTLGPALNNLAYLYAETGQNLERAQELAEQAVTVAPGSGSLRDTLGWVLFQRGRPTEAIAHLQQAARLAPNNPTIQFHLGKALHSQGKTNPARTALEKALQGNLGGKDREEAESLLRSTPRT